MPDKCTHPNMTLARDDATDAIVVICTACLRRVDIGPSTGWTITP